MILAVALLHVLTVYHTKVILSIDSPSVDLQVLSSVPRAWRALGRTRYVLGDAGTVLP